MDRPTTIADFVAEAARAAGSPDDPADVGAIGVLLVDLAKDLDLLEPYIAQVPRGTFGAASLHRSESGPQLLLVHRPDGAMSYTHSHAVWVAFATVLGVETHQQYEVVEDAGDRATLELVDERRLSGGDVVTMVPPRDIHSHGHVAGTGDTPYSLVLTGADQFGRTRREFDLETGAARDLPPGEFGTLDRT